MAEQSEIKTDYLAASTIVDFHHPEVFRLARTLAQEEVDTVGVARRCYLFVRDEIAHSFDINRNPVSCSASEVLHNGHGICYAQSHLLAALLRANGIPAGFSYQRLSDDRGGFALHAFNTVYLPKYGWYRIDARGNTGNIDAQFCPPQEKLAFSNEARGEIDYGLNLFEPLPCLVKALKGAKSIKALRNSLPSSIRMG